MALEECQYPCTVVIGARGELDVAAGTETVVCMEGEGGLVAEDGMASCCDISGGAASVSASPAGSVYSAESKPDASESFPVYSMGIVSSPES